MKTAEEWSKEIGEYFSGNDRWNKISPEQVRLIQADALCHEDGFVSIEELYRLEGAIRMLIPFACAYGSHPKRNSNDSLDVALSAAKSALAHAEKVKEAR